MIAKGDSAASHHYWKTTDRHILQEYTSQKGPSVHQPDNSTLASTGAGYLPLHSSITNRGSHTMVLPQLHSSSLVSLGQLCDDNCLVLLSATKLYTFKNGKVILTGDRSHTDGLWDIPITQNPSCTTGTSLLPLHRPRHTLAVMLRRNQPARELVQYLHAACFSPVPSTWLTAINRKKFLTWPGLTEQLVQQHLPQSQATVQGHMHRDRQHLRSTQPAKNIPLSKTHCPTNPLATRDFSSAPTERVHQSVYLIIDHKDLNRGYQDLTGRFPLRSSRGNEYILVGYHPDSNYICGVPVKNRTAPILTEAWKTLHANFSKAGTAPTIWVLDNEVSHDLISAFDAAKTKYQFVPPHSHRRNQAERAIQTFKNHLKAGLASMDPNYPLAEWDRIIPQANITLNLLRNANSNPALSAYAYLYGPFDFNSTPLAPPGTRVIAYLDPTQRGTWDLNGEVGWYVGPAMNHYRCVEIYFTRTRTTRVCDTVRFFPHEIPFPQVTTADHLKQAASDIVYLLKNPAPSVTPSLTAGNPIHLALTDLATQLGRIDSSTGLPPEIPPSQIQSSHPATPPRVSDPPRVPVPQQQPPPTAPSPIDTGVRLSQLQNPRNSPKNQRFPATPTHQYQLRSKSNFDQPLQPAQSRARLARRTHEPRMRGRNSLAAQHLAITSPHHHLNSLSAFLSPQVNHIYRPDGNKETIDTILKGSDRTIWNRSLSNEWGRLAQGNDTGVRATDTIEFIPRREVPLGRDVTYATFVIDYRPLKAEPYRIRITVGGDRLTCNYDTGSPAANLLETKLLVNSIISDAHTGARFFSADIQNYFLATPMDQPEYMRVKYKYFPADIRKRYQLDNIVTVDGYIYIRINKGMYGLKQAALLAYNNLKRCLAPHGYAPVPGTVGLWNHHTRPIQFCLCVDDFGIKYSHKHDAQHLLDSINQHYAYTTDWTGSHYCGLTFDWHYEDGYVDVSMPNYVTKSLTRLKYQQKVHPQYSPHEHVPIQFGTKGTRQYATAKDTSPKLSPQATTHIQSITGSFLYYGRAIDASILPAINEIASAQSQPTQKTAEKTQRLMDYLHTYSNAYIRYYASDMILHIDSDAAYLVAPKARSRVAGYFQLTDHPNITRHPKLNGAILVECKTLRHVVSSAAEAEVAGIFHNATMAIPIRHFLKCLNHPQPPTPLKTDNSTANGFVHDNIHQKRSKSWDMRYYWLRDRQTQEQFKFFWDRGINNEGDYYTKHHATVDHRAKRPMHIRDALHHLAQALIHAKPTSHCEGVLFRPSVTGYRPSVTGQQCSVWPTTQLARI